MLPSETMIWQPEFTDKTLSRKPGAVQFCLEDLLYSILIIEPLLNHKKLASTIRCLGIEFDDASYSSDLNKT
ncbi:hypothetical protein VSP71_21075, partial [Escherichia coli]|nr:hypothetical protein [Escherichia coli]MEC4237150.1 hypothetical protein [Escherichia coli]